MAENRKKPAAKKRGRRRSNTALWMWLSIGVVVAIVATIVIIKVTSTTKGSTETQTAQAIYNDITTIPASVFNTVGVTSPAIHVYPPIVVTPPGTPIYYTADGKPYTGTGKKYPGSFYWGAEYCPYCAATRWGIIAALSRFGTFNGVLYDMKSSPVDYAPNTPTFSFYKTTYTSQYLVFKAFEVEGPLAGQPLQTTPAYEAALVHKYNPQQSFPFMNMNNHVLIKGTAYDPLQLAGLTREQIAGGLNDPTNPATQAIVATANYVAAGLCASTKGKPGSVCASSGVMAAAHVLHLTF